MIIQTTHPFVSLKLTKRGRLDKPKITDTTKTEKLTASKNH